MSQATAVGAARAIEVVADAASFESWDDDVVSWDPLAFTAEAVPYNDRLAMAAAKTGSGESIVTGRATIAGRPVVLVVGEFGFLGGSIGVASGERVVRAFEQALDLRLPVVAITSSGGTRMQEGTPAFLQMVKAAAAVERLRAAGLCYIAYLQDPTMGGVLASWGSLATVTFAAPGARLGFSGPRVAGLLTGSPFPAEVQAAENLLGRGLLDDVFPLDELPPRVARVLAAAPAPTPALVRDTPPAHPGPATGDAWASVVHSRHPRRPGARELLDACATDVTVLRGDRSGSDDDACLTCLARLNGIPAVVVAQVRTQARPSRMGPAGYRKARRAMALAEELRLPLVTLIDTPGAELSAHAEESGLSGEIARCIATLVTLPAPTVSVLMGEGGGGGALALFPADRIICAEHAWLSPIAPEGASAILWRTTERAPDLARAHGGASWALHRADVVDRVVPEPSPASDDPAAFLHRMVAALTSELAAAAAAHDAQRRARRADRLRRTWSPPG